MAILKKAIQKKVEAIGIFTENKIADKIVREARVNDSKEKITPKDFESIEILKEINALK